MDGMTDMQFKSVLLDYELQWKEVLKLAQEAGNGKIIEKAQEQIDTIEKKLKL